jgi:hypothetical protein
MKVLLLLNGPLGWQTGIEDGFTNLLATGKLTDLKWFYFDDYSKLHSASKCYTEIIDISNNFLPNLIVFFHIGKFPINEGFLSSLKKIPSNPAIVYDEGDMYGGIAKPVSKSMKLLFKTADVVSIRGLGKWHELVNKYNRKVIYTPHHADISRFNKEPNIYELRQNDIILIGNRVKPRFLSSIRRMSGAKGRENFVKIISETFGTKFKLYGNGWENFKSNKGSIGFQDQMEYYKNSWVTVAYEHYPEIPYYFSNRLPIALLSGSLYVCHYHEGYEKIFQEGDFIFFFKSNDEAIDIIKYIFSLSEDELLERAKRASEFAIKHFTPEVIWSNFLNNVKKELND